MGKTFKMRVLTVVQPDQKWIFVDLTIADAAEAEQVTESLVASVQIPRKGLSLENVQLVALDRLREMIGQSQQVARDLADKIERNAF